MTEIKYEMSFADYCAHPAVNQSSLQILLEGSPADLQASLIRERKQSKATRIGSITHYLLLQPDLFTSAVVVRPECFENYKTTGARKWRDDHEAAGRLVCSPQERFEMEAMRASVRGHPIAGHLLKRGHAEVSLFATDPDTGLDLKARLDFIPDQSLIADGPVPILDLKTARNVNLGAWRRAVRDDRYYFQAASYLHIAQLCGLARDCFIHCAVKSSPPYTCETYQVGHRYLERGVEEFKSCLQIYKQCAESGDWPGSTGAITVIDID